MLKTSFHPSLCLELYVLASGEFIVLLKPSPLKNIFWLFTCLFLMGKSEEDLESRNLGEWNTNYVSPLFLGEIVSASRFH